MGVLGMQLNILIIKTHTLNRPFFRALLQGQLNLHHNIIKGTSLNE